MKGQETWGKARQGREGYGQGAASDWQEENKMEMCAEREREQKQRKKWGRSRKIVKPM